MSDKSGKVSHPMNEPCGECKKAEQQAIVNERERIVKEIKAFDKKVAGSPGCYDYRCGISGVLQTIDPDNEDYIKPEKLTNT